MPPSCRAMTSCRSSVDALNRERSVRSNVTRKSHRCVVQVVRRDDLLHDAEPLGRTPRRSAAARVNASSLGPSPSPTYQCASRRSAAGVD